MATLPGLSERETARYTELVNKRHCTASELGEYFVYRARINRAEERVQRVMPAPMGLAAIAADSLSRMSTWRPPDPEPAGDSAEAYARHHYRAHIRS